MKNAEIQKIMVNKIAQDLFDESEGQGCSGLHSLEDEQVKLTGDSTGTEAEVLHTLNL